MVVSNSAADPETGRASEMKEPTIKDLMVPIEKYAVVGPDATVQEALIRLLESQKLLPQDSFKHRAVLINYPPAGELETIVESMETVGET